MSLVNKLQEGGTPRLYSRGNDLVDLDAYIRLAEIGLDDFLSNFNKKSREQVRAAYQDLINRINDNPESITAKLGGGFDNTVGLTNPTKGFNAYGYAAGYLGRTLRGMDAYVKPQDTTKVSTKAIYDRNKSLITSDMLKLAWGDNAENFIKLDGDVDPNTDLRGISARINKTTSWLQALRDRLEDYYSFNSDDDKLHAQSRIDATIADLQNDTENDDWFSLGLLGFTDINKYMFTGKSVGPTDEAEQTEANKKARALRFLRYFYNNYQKAGSNLVTGASYDDSGDAPIESAVDTQLRSGISRMGDADLKEWLRKYLYGTYYKPNNFNFNTSSEMGAIFSTGPRPGTTNFTTNLVLYRILLDMQRRGSIIHKLNDDPNDQRLYVDVGNPYDKATGWIIDPEAKTLSLIPLLDIPLWRTKIMNDFNALDNIDNNTELDPYLFSDTRFSFKKGGIIKAKLGTSLDSLMYNVSGLEDIVSWATKNYGTAKTTAADGTVTDTGRPYSSTELLNGWKDSSDAARDKEAIGESWTPNIQNAYNILKKYKQSGNMIKDVLSAYDAWTTANPGIGQDFGKFIEYYNGIVDRIRTKSLSKFSSKLGDGNWTDFFNDYNTLYNSNAVLDPKNGGLGILDDQKDILGSTMFMRNALSFRDDDEYKDLRNGIIGNGNLITIDNDGHLKTRKISDLSEGEYNSYISTYGDEIEDENDLGPNDKVSSNRPDNLLLSPNFLKILEDRQKSFLGEVGPPKSGKSKFLDGSNSWLGYALGTGRLAGSLWSNRIIRNIVRDSLVPKLHNTYELYSPVKGDFATKQAYYGLGADKLFLANKPFSSDAALNAAQMLDGQMASNQLLNQGNLADNTEIKRTQEEALKRQEDNIARRTAVANENSDAIIANNQTKAQLEALKVQKDWTGIDNYLQGIETRVWSDIDTAKAKAEAQLQKNDEVIYDNVLKANAALYKTELDKIDSLVKAWETANPTLTAESLPWYDKVQNRKTELALRLANDNNLWYANKYGITDYKNLYGEGQYYDPKKYDWATIIKRSGGLLTLNFNKLIDKTIRDYEINS